MVRIPSSVRSSWLVSMTVILLAGVTGAPMAFGQFGLPKIKIPKIGKQEAKPAARAKKQKAPPPEVTAITPSSVPPGWEGDVVFTGQNFTTTMRPRVGCSESVKTQSFKVESPERAVLHVEVPFPVEDGACGLALEVPPPGSTAEVEPSEEGTFQVVEVKSATFGISQSSNLPVAFSACFVSEGETFPEEIHVNRIEISMREKEHGGCKLMVSADSVKYVDQGKTVLDQPASAIKKLDQILLQPPIGPAIPVGFRITLANGKIYNFGEDMYGGRVPKEGILEALKRKWKK